MLSYPLRLLICLAAVTLFATSARADKVTEPTPFPKVENDMVGISRDGFNADKNLPWGVCIGIMISRNKVLTDAHCVTKEITSKEPATQVQLQRFPFGTKVK